MRSRPRHPAQRRERDVPRRLVAHRRRQRQREERRIVARGAALLADLDDARDGARSVRRDAADDGAGILAGQRGLAGVSR